MMGCGASYDPVTGPVATLLLSGFGRPPNLGNKRAVLMSCAEGSSCLLAVEWNGGSDVLNCESQSFWQVLWKSALSVGVDLWYQIRPGPL